MRILPLGLLLAATACSSSGTPTATGPSATTPATPSPGPSVTRTQAPSTAPPSTPPSTPASKPAAKAPAKAPAVVVTGRGSRFTVPEQPTMKALGPQGSSCFGLVDAGYKESSCEQFQSKLGRAVALVETRGTSERDLVWTVSGSSGSTARLALRSTRTAQAGSEDSERRTTSIRTSDLASDNTQKVVFLTPQGSDFETYSAVDVVEASGRVVIHRGLGGGTAGKAFGGGLDTYVPTASGNALHTVIAFRQGSWRIVRTETVRSSDAKDSNF